MPSSSSRKNAAKPELQEGSPQTVSLSATPQRLLTEVDLLMREGLRRIADVQTDLPQARHPLVEALELSEKQTLRTLEYVELGRAAVEDIRHTSNGYIDAPLDRIAEAFSIILESQQGQDLAGQRLKKALTLMNAVHERIAAVLKDIPMDPPLAGADDTEQKVDASPAKDFAQDDVDALLMELGI